MIKWILQTLSEDSAIISEAVQNACSLLEQIPVDHIPAITPLTVTSPYFIPPNPNFGGRESELNQLARLIKNVGEAKYAILSLHGEEGVGKTELAVEFAHRYGKYFAGGVFWLPATDALTFQLALSECAMLRPDIDESNWQNLPFPKRLELAISTLRSPLPRLLILDSTNPKIVLKFLEEISQESGCSVLLLSSEILAGEITQSAIHLKEFQPKSSIQLLKKLQPNINDLDAETIAIRLNNFPLAVFLAGCYLKTTYQPINEYLAELDNKILIQPNNLSKNIAITRSVIEMNWQALGKTKKPLNTVSQTVLLIAAQFKPNTAILLWQLSEIFSAYSKSSYSFKVKKFVLRLANLSIANPELSVSELSLAIQKAVELGILAKERSVSGTSARPHIVRLHTLVANYLSTRDTSSQNRLGVIEEYFSIAVLRQVNSSTPTYLRDWQNQVGFLTANALKRADLASAKLAIAMGNILGYDNNFNEVLPFFRSALQIREKLLGKTDGQTLASVSDLAHLYLHLNDYFHAYQLFEQYRISCEKVYGKNSIKAATAYRHLAVYYINTGEYTKAVDFSRKTLTIRKKLLTTFHPDTIFSIQDLALSHYLLGEYDRAEPLYQEALKLYEQNGQEDSYHYGQCSNQLGKLYLHKGAYLEAISLLKRAYSIFKNYQNASLVSVDTLLLLTNAYYSISDFPIALTTCQDVEKMIGTTSGSSQTNDLLLLFARIYNKLGDYAKSSLSFQNLLRIRKTELGEKHTEIGSILIELAIVTGYIGDYEERLKYLKQAKEIFEKTLGPEAPMTIYCLSWVGIAYIPLNEPSEVNSLTSIITNAIQSSVVQSNSLFDEILNNLGVLLIDMGEYQRALLTLQQALELKEKKHGVDHWKNAVTLENIASCHFRLLNFEQALSFQHRALNICKAKLGNEHPETGNYMSYLARYYQILDEFSQAQNLLQCSNEIYKKKFGEVHPLIADNLNSLAGIFQELGDYEASVNYYRHALEISAKCFPYKHRKTANILSGLAYSLQLMGNNDDALELFNQSLALREEVCGSEHLTTSFSLNSLACFYSDIEEFDKALPLIDKAIAIRQQKLPENHPSLAVSLNEKGKLYQRMGDFPASLPLFQQALDINIKTYGRTHTETAISLLGLADYYRCIGKLSECISYLQEVLSIRQNKLEKMHPLTLAVQAQLDKLLQENDSNKP